MTARGDEDVGGFDVAMDDPRAVRCIQCVGDFDGQAKEVFRSPLGRARDPVLQRGSIQELHHDEGAAVLLADVINRADIGVIQSGSGSGLAPETVQGLRVAGEFARTKI